MAVNWSSGLPTAVLEEGYQERGAENVVRSPMDVGPAKVRRRTTAGVGSIVCSQLLTTAQAATLETFYNTTMAYGSISTYFTHPRTGSTIEVRFVTPPAVTPAGPSHWIATYDLEVLP